MTKIQQLKSEIEKMQNALSNPQLPPVAKGNLEKAIENAQKELSQLESQSDDEPKPEPKPEPKVIVKPAKVEKTKADKPKAEKKVAKPQPAKEPVKPSVSNEMPTKAELYKEADKLKPEKLHDMKRVRIGCEMFAEQNESDEVKVVDTVIGENFVYPGDWILYLGDGFVFTVIQKAQFQKRCIVLKDGEKSHLTVKRTDGSTVKVKNTEGGVIQSEKKKKRRKMTANVEKSVEKLAKAMKAKGCDHAKFLDDTDMTPIDNAIWGRIAQWNAKTNQEKMTRAGIEKEGDNPRFIVETVDYSEIFKTIRYYSVCPDAGSFTRIPDSEKASIEKKFENKGFIIEYSRAELNRMYNYGDPSKKSYETHLMECKAIAADAYKTRIEKGRAEARPKYQKHYNTCRNQVFNEYNREFLIMLNEAARKHKEENKGLTFRDAFKDVRANLKKFFAEG